VSQQKKFEKYGVASVTVRGASATWASVKRLADQCSGRWRSPYRNGDHSTSPYIQFFKKTCRNGYCGYV